MDVVVRPHHHQPEAILMWAGLIRLITGDLLGKLAEAYQARLKAQNETEKLVADVAIKDIERQMADRSAAKEIRLATAGFMEMRVITALIALPFVLHLNLVALDTCFKLGWRVSAFPAPFDQWEGTILLSFFGVHVVGQGITTLASAIRGRR
jgi:hypothetical protein